MHILITGADIPVGQALATRLVPDHTLRLAGRETDLRQPEVAARLVAGVDAIAHLAVFPRAASPSPADERAILDHAARGTFVLQQAALEAGVRRIVLASRLEMLEAYPPELRVDETFKPCPETDAASLAPFLAEMTLREFVRAEALHGFALRFGALDGEAAVFTRMEDAVRALERALTFDLPTRGYRWGTFHIDSSGRFPLDTARAEPLSLAITGERFTFAVPPAPMPPSAPAGPVTRGHVAIYGAGGPVGAVAAEALREHYTLRLTDVQAIEAIAAAGARQSPDAPLPQPLPAPHTSAVVDIADYEAVLAAAQGMDSLVNVSVVRRDLQGAFDVNMVELYNVAKAAVACGIRRLIHTGPYHMALHHMADYWWDHDVPDDAPLHPGGDLYALSKFLGGEITRVFAERHGLDVITFLYCHFMPGDGGEREDGSGCGPFVTSWEDCGAAFLNGLRAPAMPRPYEPFLICADVPHGKFPPHKARRLLGWEARHRFERLWSRK